MWRAAVATLVAVVLGAEPSWATRRDATLEDSLRDGDLDGEDVFAVAAQARGNLGLPAARAHAWLSFVGLSRTSHLGSREYGGFVVLGFPLDRLAAPRTSLAPRPMRIADGPAGQRSRLGSAHRSGVRESTPKNATAPTMEAGAVAPVEVRTIGEPPPAVVTPTPAAVTPTPAAVVEVEPSLQVTPKLARACVAQALGAAGLGVDDGRLDAVVSRARWSAVLPEVRLRVVQYDDQRLYTDTTTSSEDGRLRDSAAAQLSLEGRLTWRLDRLVYADDEPAFERMRLDRQEARAKIAHRTLEALFRWQRAWLELQLTAREVRAEARSPREEAELALKVVETEAELDVLTGGWFSRAPRGRVDILVPAARGAPRAPEARTPTRDERDAPPRGAEAPTTAAHGEAPAVERSTDAF